MQQSFVNRPRGFAAILAAISMVGLGPPVLSLRAMDYPPPMRTRRGAHRKTTHFRANGQTECERRQRQMARGRYLDGQAVLGLPLTRPVAERFIGFPYAGASLRKANLG